MSLTGFDDIEDLCRVSQDIKNNSKKCGMMIKDLLDMGPRSYRDNDALSKALVQLSRKYKHMPSKRELGLAYKEMLKLDKVPFDMVLKNILIKRAVRSDSGILNISVSMPPDKFSCRYNCYFCPNEPGMPRSYLSNEDVFRRATSVDFDTVGQVYSRLDTLEKNGHPIDKLEFRVLGGTFSCYPHTVADEFMRDLYYAANTYFDGRERKRLSLEEEQSKNVVSLVHVVGLGVETRPDEITPDEIKRFRRYGITRVEIGVQHTDDNLLKGVNRGHTLEDSKRAIKFLKDYGFKVEIHIMADLPGATPDGDKDCYRQVLRDDADLIPDYLKDYPCLDVSYTIIKKWKEQGKWKPYAEKTPDARDLKDVLIYRQEITPKWVRVNRIQRDFRVADEENDGYTSQSIKPNLAEIVKREAEERGIFCQCIRCREVRLQDFNMYDVKIYIESFPASGGIEYFISAEVPRPNRNLLLGFIRLRLSSALCTSIIPELTGRTAMIRELHVYGKVKEVSGKNRVEGPQHFGLGKLLLKRAELIAKENGFGKMAIIAGIGVRGYYKKQGYHLDGSYMTKSLNNEWKIGDLLICLFTILVLFAAYHLNKYN